MKKLLLGAALLAIAVGAATAYVLVPVAASLSAARAELDDDIASLAPRDLARARAEIEDAHARLSGPIARVLSFVPVVGANLDALESVTGVAPDALTAAERFQAAATTIRRDGVVAKGRVRVDALAGLADPLAGAVAGLERLERAAGDQLGGWLLPPLWDALENMRRETARAAAKARSTEALLDRLRPILGSPRPRTYLVLLINNAELRGAGGVMSGVGTLTFRDGDMELGPFTSVHDLREFPPQPVAAPPLYERRFGVFKANTTLWLNATYSPEVPDVALVASRLYRRTTGTSTDGAIAIDPRGLAALMPDSADIELPGLRREVTSGDLARIVYSDAYELFDDQAARRNAILALGRAAFEEILAGGLDDEDDLVEAGAAVAAGHLRFVTFDPRERAALDALGISGTLPASPRDSLLVTVQNFGGGIPGEGSKLDYWARRETEHACNVRSTGVALCATTVSIENVAPQGLSRYVAGVPYGLLRSYVEIYVPRNARLDDVRVDGRRAEFRPEAHGDRVSVGIYVDIARGETTELGVVYRLPLEDDGYGFVATPQPLARDASLRLSIAVPTDWSAVSGGEIEDGVIRATGRFDGAVRVEARPERFTGISALWDALHDFWTEPVF